jgi:hypothetical protein
MGTLAGHSASERSTTTSARTASPTSRNRITPGTALWADWRLDDGTFIEYGRFLSDVDHRDRLVAKIERASAAGIPVLGLTPDDLVQLDRRLGRFRQADSAAP